MVKLRARENDPRRNTVTIDRRGLTEALSPLLHSPRRYRSPELFGYYRAACPSILDARLEELRHVEAGLQRDWDDRSYVGGENLIHAKVNIDDLNWSLYPSQIEDPRLRITPTPSPSPDSYPGTPGEFQSTTKRFSSSSRASRYNKASRIHSKGSSQDGKSFSQKNQKSGGMELQSASRTFKISKTRQPTHPKRKKKNEDNRAHNTHNMITRSKSWRIRARHTGRPG